MITVTGTLLSIYFTVGAAYYGEFLNFSDLKFKIQNASNFLIALLIALSLRPYVMTIYSSCSISAEILKTNNN